MNVRDVLRDERGFFLVSALKKAGKVVVGAATAAGRLTGILPPAQGQAPAPQAEPPAVAPRVAPTPPQQVIRDNVVTGLRRIISPAAEGAAQTLTETATFRTQQRNMLLLVGAGVGVVVLVVLLTRPRG